MKLEMDDAQLKSLFGEAFLARLSDEQRDDLIKQALAYLMEPQKGQHYGSRTESPLEEVFRKAVHDYASRAVREWLQDNTEQQERFRKIFIVAWERFLAGHSENLSDTIAEKFSKALLRDHDY
jgi:hypothetical protein